MKELSGTDRSCFSHDLSAVDNASSHRKSCVFNWDQHTLDSFICGQLSRCQRWPQVIVGQRNTRLSPRCTCRSERVVILQSNPRILPSSLNRTRTPPNPL